jgi:peptide-methionine (S)-S-oxide reductase
MRINSKTSGFLGGLMLSAIVLSGAATADGQTAPLPNPVKDMPMAKTVGQQTAVFAGGCFWGVEAVFRHVKGVISSTSGYAGGAARTADYAQVSTGTTGHAESVQVVYDPAQISYGQLLKVFFAVAHNPTELNRQGPDHGTQYRSAIFATSDSQQQVARAYIDQIQPLYKAPVVTQVGPLQAFYPAEPHHQNYLALHPTQPYIVYNDLPKLDHLREQFPALYR